MNLNRFWKIYFLPGIVFQSILMGGGYATGREVVEYCARFGYEGVFVTTIVAFGFALLFFLSIDLSISTKSFDYRSWSKQMLGLLWPMFDVLFIIMSIIAIAVVTAAVCNIMEITISFEYQYSIIVIVTIVGILSYKGRSTLEKFKTLGSLLLYIAFFIFLFCFFNTNKHSQSEILYFNPDSNWFVSSLKYILYNAVVIPACLFTFDVIENRRQAIISSIIAGVLGVVPMLILLMIFIGPFGTNEILKSELPLFAILTKKGSNLLLLLYYLTLLYTLIETCTGLLHAINNRINQQFYDYKGKKINAKYLTALSIVVLLIASFLSKIGIITLVAKGYGTMAWGFAILMVAPLIINFFNRGNKVRLN